jgi:hypothetical protein
MRLRARHYRTGQLLDIVYEHGKALTVRRVFGYDAAGEKP